MILPMADIYWAAGVIEGEGSFLWAQDRRIEINVSQKDPEILHRLIQIFGGRLQYCVTKTRNPIWRWSSTGSNASGIMMTMYSLMSVRRRMQIKRALDGWKSKPAWTYKQRAARGMV